MSILARECVAGLLTLALAVTVYGLWPVYATWCGNRRVVREFRRQLRALHSGRVRAWDRSSGGREPPW